MDTNKARTFIGQARGRHQELEAALAQADSGHMDLPALHALSVSLGANLRSADAALAVKGKAAAADE